MQEYFFEPKGIYYRTNDFSSNKKTLVFVHGLSGSSSAWTFYEERFKDMYNILTFDLRGHGKSKKPKYYRDYEIRDFAEDLEELLMECGIASCVLISHSFASLIALEFLKTNMKAVERVVFLSPSYHAKEPLIGKLLDPLLWATKILGLLPHSTSPKTHIDYNKYPNSGDWNIPRMIADVRNTGLKVYLYCSRQALQVNYKHFLEHITIPTLLMHGRKDTIFPFQNSVVMNQKIKNSKLILLPAADHIIPLNFPSEVCGAIEEFLGN
jgi:pimeloyl-ACP methyl ester carboxylesterase